jgi:hypothetical protein
MGFRWIDACQANLKEQKREIKSKNTKIIQRKPNVVN